jgi:aspartyl-tRNA(Asn)/glutamyl-tRNA(Gln) amidotransferase subunit B
MERGEMRVEANVSVAPAGTRSAGYVEIKNLNSFKAMERAVAYEIKRQEAIVRSGGVIEKQTLGWDEGKQATFPQRTKEGSADYRYFPDPDLPSLKLSEIEEFNKDSLKSSLPELPGTRRERYKVLGIRHEDADAFVRDTTLGSFVDDVLSGLDSDSIKTAANYIANDLVALIRDSADRDTKIQAISRDNFRKLVGMVRANSITSRSAKDILSKLVLEQIDPETYAKAEGLLSVDDDTKLRDVAVAVIAGNETVAADYKAGKASALEYLLGQCMKELRGAGNPAKLRSILAELLT